MCVRPQAKCLWLRFRFEGQATVFAPHLGGPCYRCLFPEPPDPGSVPNCAEAGVLGVLPGIIGLIAGDRGDQTGSRRRRTASRAAVAFRRFENEVPRIESAAGSGLSCLRRQPDNFEPIDYEIFCGIPRKQDSIPAISVHELKRKNGCGESFQLIDVREAFEHEIARIDGAKLIPLREIGQPRDEFKKDQPIIVHCHSGQRSAAAVRLLRERGSGECFQSRGRDRRLVGKDRSQRAEILRLI